MRGIVDYAGLFPPASLPMAAAVDEYARHRDGPDAWALGRFVLPAARLEEFEERRAGGAPSRGGEVLGAVRASRQRSSRRTSPASRASTRLIATRDRRGARGHRGDEGALAPGRRARGGAARSALRYVYGGAGRRGPGGVDRRHRADRAKAKIRTGGVTPDAFPSSAQVARFIERCIGRTWHSRRRPGLHHPWRAELPADVRARRARRARCSASSTCCWRRGAARRLRREGDIGLVDERTPAPCDSTRGVALAGGTGSGAGGQRSRCRCRLERARESMAAFGSCSFREPVDDLRAHRPAVTRSATRRTIARCARG